MDRQAVQKRNFYALTLEGMLFWVGFAFLDSNSVIPVFINTYTGSLYLAGLAATLRTASSLLAQLAMGPHVQRVRNMPSFIIRIMLLFRPLPLLMVPVLLLSTDTHTPVWIFLIIFSLLWVSDGIIVVPWLDLFARTIHNGMRGKLLGYQQVLGGIGSLFAGLIIKEVLEHPVLSDGARYSIIFGSAGIVLLVSSIAMSFARDIPREIMQDKPNPIEYFRKLPGYFKKNRLYARMVITQIMAGFGWMVMPFVILFNKDTFGLNPTQISTLIYTQIVGTLIGGIIWGNISHRLGNKYVIMTSQVIIFILSLLVLISSPLSNYVDPFWLAAAMSLLTGLSMGAWMGFVNYTIDVTEEAERPIYFVLTSVITLPLTLLPFFSGLLADAWGFIPLFLISMGAAILAFIIALGLKPPFQPPLETPGDV